MDRLSSSHSGPDVTAGERSFEGSVQDAATVSDQRNGIMT